MYTKIFSLETWQLLLNLKNIFYKKMARWHMHMFAFFGHIPFTAYIYISKHSLRRTAPFRCRFTYATMHKYNSHMVNENIFIYAAVVNALILNKPFFRLPVLSQLISWNRKSIKQIALIKIKYILLYFFPKL